MKKEKDFIGINVRLKYSTYTELVGLKSTSHPSIAYIIRAAIETYIPMLRYQSGTKVVPKEYESGIKIISGTKMVPNGVQPLNLSVESEKKVPESEIIETAVLGITGNRPTVDRNTLTLARRAKRFLEEGKPYSPELEKYFDQV